MPTQNLLRLSLLLMLMMRNVSTTVYYRFGRWGLVIKLNFCSDFEHKFWSRFWSWSSGEILKLKFDQYFASDVWLRLRSWILVNILKLGLVNILNFKFIRDVDVWSRFRSWCLVGILKMKFGQDLCLNLWYDPKNVTLVSRTQPSGPLCLWQCLRIIPLYMIQGNNHSPFTMHKVYTKQGIFSHYSPVSRV